jgi:hypothetical protein
VGEAMSDLMAGISKQPTAPFNPYFGCLIMTIVLCMGIGGVIWIVHVGRTMDREIGKFTVDQPVKPEGPKLDAAGVDALKKKLESFAVEAKADKPATLALSIAELNALCALAPDTGYGSFTDILAFKATSDDQRLVADVCLPLNKNPLEGGKRYAIGEAQFKVEVIKDVGPDIKIDALKIPGKEVNEGFMRLFGGFQLLSPYHKLDSLKPVMKAIQSLKVKADGIEFSTRP